MNDSATPVRVSRGDGIAEGSISERWRVGEHHVLVQLRDDRACVYLPYTANVSKERQEEAAEAVDAEFEFTPIIDGEVIVIPYGKVMDFLVAVDL